MNMKLKLGIVYLLLLGTAFSSCEDFFDVSTEDMLDASENYNEKAAINAGMIGLSASFRKVADHHIILSELLGDLMIPTNNAPDECWEIFRYNATNGNSFASPVPYYNLVVNCNDFLRNLIGYNKKYPNTLATNVYRGMISTALTYRAWAYLQIGKIYGEAVYYDFSFVDNNNTVPSKVLKLEQLIPELIYNLKTGVDGVNGFNTLNWNTIISPSSQNNDESWNYISVNAEVLLIELYLWDKDYTNAAKTGLNYVNGTGDKYKLNVFISDHPDRMWRLLFANNPAGDHWKEICTMTPYNFVKGQTGKLQYYFSSLAPNVYYFQPSITAIMRYLRQIVGKSVSPLTGETQLRRGTDEVRFSGTYTIEKQNFVIGKYHLKKKNYEQDAPVYIYRAAEVYLMIAEALSGLGGETNITAADSLLNVGLKPSWRNDHFEQPFDAPIYGSVLNVCPGIRGRIRLAGDYVNYHVDSVLYPGKTDAEKVLKLQREKFVIDSLLTEETALELAYEGKRWFALMRIARNSGKPELLARIMAAKFDPGEALVYEKWLMDPKNWFVRWDQRNVTKQLTEDKK